MKTAVKSTESAVYRHGLGIFLTETPPTDAPKHLFRPLFPRNPHFPACGPSHWLFQGPPAESKFLAATRFAQLDADGLFETLDATPGLLEHRVPGVHERIAWAVENPPADTRAAARGAVVRKFYGTPEAAKIKVGWSFAIDTACATQLDFPNPFNPYPIGLPIFFAPTMKKPRVTPPRARHSLRQLLGL